MVGAGKPIPGPSDSDGLATYFYTNAQSGRLMFYHEHALGITRLGVYVGMAAPYLLVDSTEDGLINATYTSQSGGRGLQLRYSPGHPGPDLCPQKCQHPGQYVG